MATGASCDDNQLHSYDTRLRLVYSSMGNPVQSYRVSPAIWDHIAVYLPPNTVEHAPP